MLEKASGKNIARRYTCHTYQHLVVWLCACLKQFASADTWSRHTRDGACKASTRAAKILASTYSSFSFVVDRAGIPHAVAFAKKHWGNHIRIKSVIQIQLKAGKDYRVSNPSREVAFERIPFTAARFPIIDERRAEVEGMRTASVPAPLERRPSKGGKVPRTSTPKGLFL